MCIAAPGKVIEIFVENGLRMGRIDYGGIVKIACLEHVPEAMVGSHVLVHAGFAISEMDEAAATEFYQFWDGVEQKIPATKSGKKE